MIDSHKEIPDGQQSPWTIGQLRKALNGLPEDLPLRVGLDDDPAENAIGRPRVVTGASFDGIRWADPPSPWCFAEDSDPSLTIHCRLDQ